MYVEHVSIHDFKGIEDCDLSFRKGFNLIIGENGKGKTSLLEALSIGISGFLSGVHAPGVHARNFQPEEARAVYSLQGDGGYEPEYHWPSVRMTAEFEDAKDQTFQEYQWTRFRESHQAQTKTDPRDVCNRAETMSSNANTVLPVICYQSAARVWSQKRKKQSDRSSREKRTRLAGYVDCLSDESSVKQMLKWCVDMEMIAWQTDKPVREYEAVKKAVGDAMSQMEGRATSVFYDKRSEELMYRQGQDVTPISALSAGYQSLIWMVFDIAYRMAVLNPFLMERIAETPGLVLIDELDLHLHPRWQWQVIDVLRRVFPRVQFIATTHSPIIIASAKDVWCIDIENLKKPKEQRSGYGLEVNYILRQVQNASDLPDSIQSILENFYQCIDAEDFMGAKKALARLESEIGKESPLAVKARERLELELALSEG